MNELTTRRKRNASVKELKLNDIPVTNPRELSDTFINHFSTIGPTLILLTRFLPPVTDDSSYAY